MVNLVAILLNAGTETTRNQLAAAVQVLSEHPDQWALLAEHPELAPKAVEELMRHSPIVFASLRVATTDIEPDDVLIPAGTFVLANTAAANRDPGSTTTPSVSTSPGGSSTHADLRRRRALLSRCAFGPVELAEARCHHCQDVECAPHRPRAVEADHRAIGPTTFHRIHGSVTS